MCTAQVREGYGMNTVLIHFQVGSEFKQAGDTYRFKNEIIKKAGAIFNSTKIFGQAEDSQRNKWMGKIRYESTIGFG